MKRPSTFLNKKLLKELKSFTILTKRIKTKLYLLHDGGQVDGRSGTDPLGVAALLEKAMDASNGVLKSGARRLGLGRLVAASGSFFSFATSGHLAKVDGKS